MIVLSKPLHRRTFLRGLGAAMALPLLDSMVPMLKARTLAAGQKPVRLGYIYTPNGIVGACDKSPRPFLWTPKTAGANFELSPTMKALEPFRDQLNVFSGLAQVNGRALGDGPGDHARAAATFLTGAHPYKTGGADVRLGISADQIAARELGRFTQLASLELGLESQRVEVYRKDDCPFAPVDDLPRRSAQRRDGTTTYASSVSEGEVPQPQLRKTPTSPRRPPGRSMISYLM